MTNEQHIWVIERQHNDEWIPIEFYDNKEAADRAIEFNERHRTAYKHRAIKYQPENAAETFNG